MKKQMFSVQNDKNNIFASGQAIPAASDGVLRPTSHGSRCEPDAKIALCGLAASSGVLNPRRKKNKDLLRFKKIRDLSGETEKTNLT